MNIGIKAIGKYVGEIVDCRTKLARHGVNESFLVEKTGFIGNARMDKQEKASDMCVHAFRELENKTSIDTNDVDFVLVCTQNGDFKLPQTSAILHSKLQLDQTCAALDISLGCSGYVYAIDIAKSFMESNGLKCGLVFTADPYSEIIDENDKNTDLLFGDAATVTLLSFESHYTLGKPVFSTFGHLSQALRCNHQERLYMDGRKIFEFALRTVPQSITTCLKANGLSLAEVDLFLLHQASRYLVENMAKRLKVDSSKVPFVASEYGNTVSSSIPLALELFFGMKAESTIILSGFGVGLSVATTTLRRV